MSPIDVWRRIVIDARKSWVLFENGTCVIFAEPGDDLAGQAVALLREWGPVHAGDPGGGLQRHRVARWPGVGRDGPPR